ncbi:hypothetical protein M9Y10_012629 [Tritrichomonas musculus]|uniref:C2 domain-containing protein n=1 Tax=Tritrichomonas musculus TaxID=1915356 RepID=A0ABR2IEI7_9EUKA
MTESVLYLRVSKINGATPKAPNGVRALRAFIRPGDRHYTKHNCYGSQTLDCSKIFKIFFKAIGKQSIIIKLLDLEPKVIEIASLSIPLSWIPREYYIAETFPLRPLIPGIASPIAFVEIQLSSNENISPFTLPPADLIHIPAWRPYPKVELPVKPVATSNNSTNQSNQNNLINFNSNANQNQPNSFANKLVPEQQGSINIKLKRKRSSSFCVENLNKLEELISDNSSSESENEYSEESTSVEPAAEYKLYMAFTPPVMKNGMEPAKLEPKTYSDAELSEILNKHAYTGAILNGQYINPPRCFTKNTPLCDKVKNEKNKGKSINNTQDDSKNSTNNDDDNSERRHRHRHRHYHYHHKTGDPNNDHRTRSNTKTPNSNQIKPSYFSPNKDTAKIDQRSNSIQMGGRGFFQRSMNQKLVDLRNAIRPTPPPDYQELQNDILFKDDM